MIGLEKLLSDPKTLVVVSHSGGKDSQAMWVKVRAMVPKERLLVVHANLPGVEWGGTEEHAKRYCEGYAFVTCQAQKTFFEMVERRQMFPSSSHRQCTSDLKRDPINKAVRAYLKGKEFTNVLMCIGIRAQESSGRAKMEPFKMDARNCTQARGWYQWYPIFDYSQDKVFLEIKKAGEQLHWAYGAGMSRLSCCFCIMASKDDLRTAAQLNPELYAKYVALEKKVGHTMFFQKKQAVTLEQVTGIKAKEVA